MYMYMDPCLSQSHYSINVCESYNFAQEGLDAPVTELPEALKPKEERTRQLF